MKYKNERGFTLVELLVVVVIIGIIAIIAIPSIDSIKSKNEKKKYQKYQESVEVAGELFSDSYHEDMFGITGDGCYDVSYQELAKKNLVKDFKTSGISCNTSNTFVHIERSNGKYTYKTSIMCVDEGGKVVYKDIKEKCKPPVVEDLGYPVIRASAKHLNSYGLNWSTQKEITIEVSSGLGLNSNAIISYGFSKVRGKIPTTMTRHRYINKHGDNHVTYKFIDDSNPDGSKKNGQYYLYVEGKDTLDIGAHNAKSIWIGPLNYDNEAPATPVLNNPKDNIWVGKEYVDNGKYVIGVKSSDNPSGVAYYQYRYPNSNSSVEHIWKSYDKLMGNVVITSPFKKERDHKVEIRACDYANNCSLPGTSNIKIDKTIPVVDKVTNSSNSAWVNHGVDCTASASDPYLSTNQKGSGVQKIVYTYANKEYNDWDKDTKTFVKGTWFAERDNDLYIVVYDNAGNVSKKKYNGKIRIDKSAPVIIQYSNSGDNKWTNKDVLVSTHAIDPTLASSQKGSGIKQIYYTHDNQNLSDKWDEGHSTGEKVQKKFTKDINSLITIVVDDNAGNRTVYNGGHLYIDKTPPVIANIINSSKNLWTNKEITISANITDSNGSGVSSVEYNYGGNKIANLGLVNNTVIGEWIQENNVSVNFVAHDVAGNIVSVPVGQVKIDKTNPTIGNVSNDGNSKWTKNDVTIKTDVVDAGGSGLSYGQYFHKEKLVGNISVENNQLSHKWDQAINTKVKYRIFDNAGNYSDLDVGSVKIDRTPPTITRGQLYEECNQMKLTYTMKDSESGEGYFEYKIDDGKWQKWDKKSNLWDKAGSVIKFVGYDAVGNRSAESAGDKVTFTDCTPAKSGDKASGSQTCGRLLCDGTNVYQECKHADGTEFTWKNGQSCVKKKGVDCNHCEPWSKDRRIDSTHIFRTCRYFNARGDCTDSQETKYDKQEDPKPSNSGSSTTTTTTHKKTSGGTSSSSLHRPSNQISENILYP